MEANTRELTCKEFYNTMLRQTGGFCERKILIILSFVLKVKRLYSLISSIFVFSLDEANTVLFCRVLYE